MAQGRRRAGRRWRHGLDKLWRKHTTAGTEAGPPILAKRQTNSRPDGPRAWCVTVVVAAAGGRAAGGEVVEKAELRAAEKQPWRQWKAGGMVATRAQLLQATLTTTTMLAVLVTTLVLAL